MSKKSSNFASSNKKNTHFKQITIMKKGLTTKQLAKHVYNMAKAIADFNGVQPTSINIIECDIEFIANLYNNFKIIIEKNFATVKVVSENYYQGNIIEMDVDLCDNKFYAKIK